MIGFCLFLTKANQWSQPGGTCSTPPAFLLPYWSRETHVDDVLSADSGLVVWHNDKDYKNVFPPQTKERGYPHESTQYLFTSLRYFPAKKVWYVPCFWRKAGKLSGSWVFCHAVLLQLPSNVLFTTWWLWGYLPVRILALLGQQRGLATIWVREEMTRSVRRCNGKHGNGWSIIINLEIFLCRKIGRTQLLSSTISTHRVCKGYSSITNQLFSLH